MATTTESGTTGSSISADRRDDELAELVAMARDGDEEARAALVRRVQPLVWSVSIRCGVARQDLGDVSQDVWLLMFSHLDQLRNDRAFVGWLSTITRNACVKAHRAASRTLPSEHIDELADVGADIGADEDVVGAGLERDECIHAVRSGLAQLTPRQRDLLLMVAADPPTPYRLISARLDMPIGSIGPTRARLLRRLSAARDVSDLIGGHSPAIAS